MDVWYKILRVYIKFLNDFSQVTTSCGCLVSMMSCLNDEDRIIINDGYRLISGPVAIMPSKL